MQAHLVQIVKDPLKNTDTNFQLLHTYIAQRIAP